MRDTPWEDIFKLSASASASEFCEGVQVGTDICIPNHKYQVKPHLSSWFLAACSAARVHKDYFFCLYQQNNFLNLKESSSRLVIVARVLEAAKFTYPNKTNNVQINVL